MNEFAKVKWNSVVGEASTESAGYEEETEVSTNNITHFEDEIAPVGLNQYDFTFKIPLEVLDTMVYEDNSISCKSLYQLKVHFDLIDEVGLSDKTKIQDCPWSVMKEFVMKTSDYKQHIWYKAASEQEKELVVRLIAAQTEQGDMNELIVRPKSTSYQYSDKPYNNKLFYSEPIHVSSSKN